MSMPGYDAPLGYETPKKGDIVWLEGWGGVIGEVVSYEGQTLTLTWPADPNHIFWPRESQPFYPVKPWDITILTPSQILEKIAVIFSKQREQLAQKVSKDVLHAISISSFSPYILK